MADGKRIQLGPPAPLQKEKPSKECPPTYRFDIDLNELQKSGRYEINYKELVQNAEKANKAKKEDPFNEDDENLEELARKLEEKYNPKVGRKKRKKVGLCEDYVDRGMGYDETDPFIDNGEAYDELVPSTITTKHDGFYINSGELEFRDVSENNSGVDIKARKKRSKKDAGGLTKEPKKQHTPGDDDTPKRRGRRPANETASALPKIKKKTQPTVADMLQQHKAQMQQQQQEKMQQMQFTPIVVERNLETKATAAAVIVVENTQPPALPTPTIPGANCKISEAIESVVKAAATEEGTSNGSAGLVTGSSDGEEAAAKMPINSVEAPKLPENLPSDLDVVLAKLKQAAHNSEEGKCKFFSEEVNRMLLSVELKSQQLTSAQRSTIYSHLASHLPCTKETLQKRAKKLRLDQEDNKLREPMQKLKDAISVVMPELIEKYAASLQTPAVKEEEFIDDFDAIPITDDEFSEEEEKKTNQPKKKFEWNDNIRSLLCDVVRIKLKCYEVSKTRIQSAEEYLRHFLETEVKHLWPPGWMQARTLFKESKDAHLYITNRQKKPLMLSKRSVNPTIAVKPTSLIAFTQESNNIEPASQIDRCVPSNVTLPLYMDNPKMAGAVSCNDEVRQAEFMKLLTYPIKMKFGSGKKLLSQAAPTDAKLEPVQPVKNIASVSSQKTVDPYLGSPHITSSTKSSDMNVTEGSLASDMLARIISASLADFPYAGSSNTENLHSKSQSVITSSTNFTHANKDSRATTSKLLVEPFASPKLVEEVKCTTNVDSRKSSQDTGPHSLFIRSTPIDSLLNAHHSAKSSDVTSSSLSKTKCVPLDAVKSPGSLKLKDVIVPQSHQFAEAFERSETSLLSGKVGASKIQSFKTHSTPVRNMPVSSSASLCFPNAIEHHHTSESSPSASSRLPLAPKLVSRLPQDMATKLSNCVINQGSPLTPYKKREKYAQSSKGEQWNFRDSGLGASLLEGMKGFPTPVNTMPTPPPAHCSVPSKTIQHKDSAYSLLSKQHNQRGALPYESKMRALKSTIAETPTHNQPGHHVGLPSVVEANRRQSLIVSWNTGSATQASSNPSHFLPGSQSQISSTNPTSPNHSSSNPLQNAALIHTHGHSAQVETSAAYGLNQNQLPVRPSPSPVQSHSSRTSPSSVHMPHISQALFLSHQPSHSTSSHQVQMHTHSTPFVHTHPSTPTSSTGTFAFSQEQKTNPKI